MKLSVIIPVFRGGEILKDLFIRIDNVLFNRFDYEVLFICDGCDQKSYSVLKEVQKSWPEHIRIFYFARNQGQHKAIQFGLGKAKGDFIVTMDEDLQHDPSDIPALIEKQMEGNYDVVYGHFTNLQHKGIRNNISKILRVVLKHFIPALYEYYSPYRLIKSETAHKIATVTDQYVFIDDLLCRITRSLAFVDITHHPRITGRSSYTIFRLLKHAILIVFLYSPIAYWLTGFGSVLVLSGLIPVALKAFFSLSIFTGDVSSRLLSLSGLVFLILGLSGLIIRYFGTIRSKETKYIPI
ncbi:MAG: glycosyltransferase [Bacteroidales bacterium]